MRPALILCLVGLVGPVAFAGLGHAQAVDWCSGADEDGDGRVDEGFACALGDEADCRTGCGSRGQRRCSVACTWEKCFPPAEACNGIDDDCDGQTDEGFDCVAGSEGACLQANGAAGVGRCDAECRWATCIPVPGEYCNGRDDDGDGVADETFECRLWDTSACGPDDNRGLRQCTAACRWGACQQGELCNGRDDNGNGLIDEGIDYVDLEARRLPDGVPRTYWFQNPTCAADRLALAMYTGLFDPVYGVQVYPSDGVVVSEWWGVCEGLDFATKDGRPVLAWHGDSLIVACDYPDQLTLQRFSQSGESLTLAYAVDYVRHGPWHMASNGETVVLTYPRLEDEGPRVVVQELSADLEPIGEPIVSDFEPFIAAPEDSRDGVNATVIHDDVGLAMFVTTLHPGTGARQSSLLEVDLAQRTVQQRFALAGPVVIRPERFGDGWAMIRLLANIVILDADGQLKGSTFVAGADAGAAGVAAARYEVEERFSTGVSGDQYLVAWPYDTLTRYSLDGRLSWISQQFFNGAVPRESGVFVGCVLGNGQMMLVSPGNSIFGNESRWMSRVGCPEGEPNGR